MILAVMFPNASNPIVHRMRPGRYHMHRGYRIVLVCLAASSAPAGMRTEAAAPTPGAVNFPGDGAKELPSGTGFSVFYTDPRWNAEGIDERPIRLRYPDGHTEQIDTFIRNADVSWSPDGHRFVITNWIGSNVADCSAITPSSSSMRERSLTSLIVRTGPADVSRDIQQGDPVYVSCSRWLAE